MSILPPEARMGTLTPVFPKGRVGITRGSSADSARDSMGAMTEPTPAAPAAFRKSLRDQFLSVGAMMFLHNARVCMSLFRTYQYALRR